MAAAGTLPDYCYKRAVIPSSERNLYAGPSNDSNNPPRSTENEESATSFAETREQEASNHSDEETEEVQFEPDAPSGSVSGSGGDNVGIDASSLFLVGRSSRAGRRTKSKLFILIFLIIIFEYKICYININILKKYY